MKKEAAFLKKGQCKRIHCGHAKSNHVWKFITDFGTEYQCFSECKRCRCKQFKKV